MYYSAYYSKLGFGLDRSAKPQPVGFEVVKLIKRCLEYSNLTRKFSGVSDATDEALDTLENGSYIFDTNQFNCCCGYGASKL